MKEWLTHELNGYPEIAVLPEYRTGFTGHVKAHMFGALGREMRNVPVPVTVLPDWIRDVVHFEFRQGVAALEAFAASESRALTKPLPVEAFANLDLISGYAPLQMWAELPIEQLVGLLDQIRTRALNFALEIEQLNPAAGEAPAGEVPIAPQVTSQVFHAVVLGGAVNLAQGGQDFEQHQLNVAKGDFASLWAALRSLGVEEAELDQLQVDVTHDEPDTSGSPGPKVSGWLARVTGRITAAGENITSQATAGLIAAALAKYLGLI